MAILNDETHLSLAEQRALWRRQSATLPPIRGGKRVWLRLVAELVTQVGEGKATAMDARPAVPEGLFGESNSLPGAPAATTPLTWGEYGRFLKAVGLAHSDGSALVLTNVGQDFRDNPSPESLGVSLAHSFRLLAESLRHIADKPVTVEELDEFLRTSFRTDWKSLGGVRARVDWLDALGAIEATAGRQWMITSVGETMMAACRLVTPEALEVDAEMAMPVEAAPEQIQNLLDELTDGTRDHATRSTYNIWVPSPASQPNKVENLRIIVNALVDPLSREELLEFIASTFGLRRSSVDSMLPFLRASGLILEVGYGVYQASPAALAWLQSGNDINFVRILHANMRFVGEMLNATVDGATRAHVYAEAGLHGLNAEKSRWIAAFLQDTGLIVPPRYGSLITTPTGKVLLADLPLASPDGLTDPTPELAPVEENPDAFLPPSQAETLGALSRMPQALDQGSGKAFEQGVCDAFTLMGFDAQVVSGSGATDVLVRWRDEDGADLTAVVEAKSRASGSISHTDVSDVALETHKARHGADHVAVIAPAFAGDTIKTMATTRSWTLIEASSLGTIADEVVALGVGPAVSGVLFKPDGGLAALRTAIGDRQRQLAVLTFVVGQLAEEAVETGDPITPRDISRDGRRTDVKPSVDEVLMALTTLQDAAPGAIRITEENRDPRFSSYEIGNPRPAASALRAIADAIEAPFARKN